MEDLTPDTFIPLRTREAGKFLSSLDPSSATGHDNLGTIVLKELAGVLAIPFAKLARAIVQFGIWPSIWKLHWICALHKKKSIFDPSNYRGLQLTTQLSKAMERFLASKFIPSLDITSAFGRNQFAYRQSHGARDAVLYLVMNWI